MVLDALQKQLPVAILCGARGLFCGVNGVCQY